MIMKFKRNVRSDSDQTKSEVDDALTFKMKDDEKVKVRVVKEDVVETCCSSLKIA